MSRKSQRIKLFLKRKLQRKKSKKLLHPYRTKIPPHYNPHTMTICNHKNHGNYRNIITDLIHYTRPEYLESLLQSGFLLLSDERQVASKWSFKSRECEPCAEESSDVCSLSKGIYFRFLAYDRPFLNYKEWVYYGNMILFFSPDVLKDGYYHINTTLNSGFMFPMRGRPLLDEITFTDETIVHMTPTIYDSYARSMELLYRNKVSLQHLQCIYFIRSEDIIRFGPLLKKHGIPYYLFQN